MYFQSKIKTNKQTHNLVILPQILPVLKKKESEKKQKSLQDIFDILSY